MNAPESLPSTDCEHEGVLRSALESYLTSDNEQRADYWAHFVALHAARSNAAVSAMETAMGLR